MMLDLARLARHMTMPHWRVRRAFPARSFQAIEQAIKQAETAHGGEIRFVVEGALDGLPLLRNQAARERALDVFSLLRLWDTEQRNGVLIYLLLADRHVEIVADRGAHSKVGPDDWGLVCQGMEALFRNGEYEQGALTGIRAVAQHLVRHFPPSPRSCNALPDEPVIL
jgi:uncharacterized membrane protein